MKKRIKAAVRRAFVKNDEKPDYFRIAYTTFIVTFITTFTLSMLLSISIMECSPVHSKKCITDDDCICDGTDRTTGECFVGNRKYHLDCVDYSADCPDFCHGISGDLGPKCLGGTCTIMKK